ncbi:MAG TPA: hypothetical protein PLU37_11350 [Chitinophagaceae bacterium]|nr:hypothetical protein [Chitinophagaceae bacterium]HPG12119.1 hypothetical protein [Chitinophagaceae bacterium]
MLLQSTQSDAQHISPAMDLTSPIQQKDSNSISFSYNNLFYFRDYEYFNPIQEGYTLFGTWHYPRFALQPNKWLRFEAGALLQKEFGAKKLDKVLPVFSMQFRHKNLRFLFGALEGNQAHRLPEPIMNYDMIIERPIEEGFQVKYNTDKLKADLWLDWELRQKKTADYPEELTGGVSVSYLISKPSKPLHVSIPLQLITPHKGGQLDTNHSAVYTVINTSAGLVSEWDNPNHSEWTKKVRVGLHFLGYNLSQKKHIYPFNKGNGFLSNLYIHTKWNFSFLASYWKGNQFIAPKGAPIYQSISYAGNSSYTEPKRELLFLNLIFEKEILKGLFTDMRYSPYLDLHNKLFEHSFLIYFSYRKKIFLGKIRK